MVAKALLHPVRLRIVMELVNQPMTALELSARLEDVGQTTVYRHIKRLVEASIIRVVEERQAHSNTEKVYGLDHAHLNADDVADMTPEEHKQAFAIFATLLIGQWERYVDGMGAMDTDGAGYQQVPLWLTDDEFAQVVQAISAVLRPWLDQGPGEGRRRRTLTTIIIPEHAKDQNDDDAT